MPPKAEKKNNGFDRLRADLKAQTPQNVYLFYGEETYLRSYYLEELHRLLIPAGFEEFNYHRLSGKGLTVQELAEVTEAMPMMAQHTMVVVTDLDIFRLDEQQRTALMALLADFPEYCTLVLVYDLLPYKRDGKMKKLCAALDKSVCEVEFRQQERAQLLRWVKRRFAAERYSFVPAALWAEQRQKALAESKLDVGFEAFGYDIDPAAVAQANANAKLAGVEKRCHFEVADVADFAARSEAIVLTNPPYGERMSTIEGAAKLARTLGQQMEAYPCAGVYAITADMDFEHHYGKRANKRRKMYNGMIPCQLYMYYNAPKTEKMAKPMPKSGFDGKRTHFEKK